MTRTHGRTLLKAHASGPARAFLMAGLAVACGLRCARAQTATQPLTLTISVSQSVIPEPFSATVSLHFHNAGSRAVWLYKPVHDAASMFMGIVSPRTGGASLATYLQLIRADEGAVAGTSPGVGTVLRPPDFPHPTAVKLSAGGDATESAVIHLTPATVRTAGGTRPIFGTYRLSVVYSASYANMSALKGTDVNVWQGSISSNPVTLKIEPAPDSAGGVIAGTVLDRRASPLGGMLVSISDWTEHVITQQVTAADGGFYVDGLPLGRYWVDVRPLGSDRDTGLFEHAVLTNSQPEARLRLIMLHGRVYEGRKMLHKPVFFRITDNAGNPLGGAELSILWDNGTVLSNVKVKNNEDGLAEADVIPGTNYVTVKRHGCRKKNTVANVSHRSGIDAFIIALTCKEK